MTSPALRILVVDDENDIRDILVDYFELLGHSATTAEHGRAALEKARAERFDLIVMDYLMPEMSGLELFQAVAGEALCDRVIFMSGSVELPAGIPRGDPRVMHWLEKPFPLEAFEPLLERIRKA